MEHRKPLLNFRLLSYSIGSLLLLEAACMLLPLAVSIAYNEPQIVQWVNSVIITAGVGLLLMLPTRKHHGEWGKREGYFVVASVWVWFSVFSAMALMLCGATTNCVDAFFESMSGFTTTGASIMPDVEILPHSVLIWRSFMQWLGGMGIIVLSMAFGFGSMQIYVAEVSGPTKGKMSPRVRQTAVMLWKHYFIATFVTFMLLTIAGMDVFDSVCQTFSAISTGGFSTKNESIGYWHSDLIEWIIIATITYSSINYAVSYFFRPGKFMQSMKDEETRNVLLTYFSLALVCSVVNIFTHPSASIFDTVTDSTFMSISAISGTGFNNSERIMTWVPALWGLVLVAMCIGGSSGSTTGGIKIVRISMLLRNSRLEFKRILHPRALFPLKYNGKYISTETINGVMAFVFLFIGIAIAATLVLMSFDIQPGDAIGICISALANVGLGWGSLESGNFYVLPDAAKLLLSFLMLIGRLELFTVLFLFTPAFWKR